MKEQYKTPTVDMTGLNLGTSAPKSPVGEGHYIYRGVKTAYQTATSQTHTDENYIHEMKQRSEKTLAVASAVIPVFHNEMVSTKGLQYDNISQEHLNTIGMNNVYDKYNFSTQSGVDSFKQDLYNHELSYAKKNIENNEFLNGSYYNKSQSGGFNLKSSGNFKSDKTFMDNFNAVDVNTLSKTQKAAYEQAKGIVNNLDGAKCAFDAIKNPNNFASNAVKGRFYGLQSYGRQTLATSMFDDNMKSGFNTTSAFIRPTVTASKAMVNLGVKSNFKATQAYTDAKIAEVSSQLKATNLSQTQITDLLEQKKKFETMKEASLNRYQNYNQLRQTYRDLRRGNIKGFSEDVRLMKTKATTNELDRVTKEVQRLKSLRGKTDDVFGRSRQYVNASNKQAELQKKLDLLRSKGQKNLASRVKGGKKVKNLTKKANTARKAGKATAKTVKGAKTAKRLADFGSLLKKISSGTKFAKIGSMASSLFTSISQLVTNVGGAIAAAAPEIGTVLLIIAAVILVIVIVVVVIVIIILLAGYYAIHFVSDGTDIQTSLDSINYCQAISNAVTYDIGAEYQYIVQDNARDMFSERVYVGPYGYPCTVRGASNNYSESYVWEETDNTTYWIDKDNHTVKDASNKPIKVYSDYYIADVNKRNKVGLNDNIIPIMNMMHTKMLDEITFEKWPSAMAYCYYMYAMSHSVNRYDDAALTDTANFEYIYMKNDDGTDSDRYSGYKLKKNEAGSAVSFCDGTVSADAIKWAVLAVNENPDGTYSPQFVDNMQYNYGARPTDGSCNNKFFHTDEPDAYNSSEKAVYIISRLRKIDPTITPQSAIYIYNTYCGLSSTDSNPHVGEMKSYLGQDLYTSSMDAFRINSYNFYKDLSSNNVVTPSTLDSSYGLDTFNNSNYDNENAKNKQQNCDNNTLIPLYSSDYPYGGTHQESVRIHNTSDWKIPPQPAWTEWHNPGDWVNDWTEVYPGHWMITGGHYEPCPGHPHPAVPGVHYTEEECWEIRTVPNAPTGSIHLCGGHCAGHIYPNSDLIQMMTYEGLMQLDSFKTTHWVTIYDIFGKSFIDYLGAVGEANMDTATSSALANANDPITKKFVNAGINSADVKVVAGLLALDKPFVTSSNAADHIAERYGTIGGEKVSQPMWQLYWATTAKQWFSIFPSSPQGVLNSISKSILYKAAGIMDGTTSKIFPALIKVANLLGIPEADTAQDMLDAAKDVEPDDDEDLTAFEGWFDSTGANYSYHNDELSSFFGDYYGDGYEMSLDAWEGFDVKFDPSIIPEKPKYIPNGSSGADLNPEYTP